MLEGGPAESRNWPLNPAMNIRLEHEVNYNCTMDILDPGPKIIAKGYAGDIYIGKNCLEMNMVYTWCNLKSSF